MALTTALISTVVLVALGSALALLTATEIRIAGTYRAGLEALYAADAAIAAAAQELVIVPDWDAVLAGAIRSSMVDGAASGVRATSAGSLDLTAATNLVRCGRTGDCSGDEIAAVTSERPAGLNNPIWRLYAHGRLRDLLGLDESVSDAYVVVWVGDDPFECDGMADRDGGPCDAGENWGRGVIALLAHAYARGGAQRAIEATVGRTGILTWSEVR